jgi:Na+/melibiose symporter-like transporter
MSGLFAGIPALALLAAIVLFTRFRFDEAEHALVRTERDARYDEEQRRRGARPTYPSRRSGSHPD